VEGDMSVQPFPARVKSSDANMERPPYEGLILLVFKPFSTAFRNWRLGGLKKAKKP
jgi:hypothetical protein